MLNTYLNDNQHRPYPFYGGVKLPFPMSCITGLGLCLQQGNNTSPVFASVVAISRTSIRVAFCRYTESTDGALEFIGIAYADTTGYYTYIASSANSTVYEVKQRPDPGDLSRIVFATFVDQVVEPEEHESAVMADMQVFYSFFEDYDRRGTKSTGYMQVGTIPEDAIGVYTGEFYLDPSCVTYMSADVLGYHTDMIVNKAEQHIEHSIDIAAGGLLTASVSGGTLLFGCLEEADKSQLNDYPEHPIEFIEFLNGTTTSALAELHINDDGTNIQWKVTELKDAVLLTVSGATAFSCYPVGDEA